MPHHDLPPDPTPFPTAADGSVHTVTFLRHGRLYAVPSEGVLEVILGCDRSRLFPLVRAQDDPSEPCCARLRVVDPCHDAAAPSAAAGSDQQILVCRDDRSVVGFLIDEIQGLKRMRWTSIRPAAGPAREHVIGVATVGFQLVTLLGVEAEAGAVVSPSRRLRQPGPETDPGRPAAPREAGDTRAAR
jgi:hypothetical protein